MTINNITKKLRTLSLCEQIHFLRGEVRKEPNRSVRRQEIEEILREKITKQLRRESRAA